jgi:exopolyphosphatase/pppGpp-phosphohydrolase
MSTSNRIGSTAGFLDYARTKGYLEGSAQQKAHKDSQKRILASIDLGSGSFRLMAANRDEETLKIKVISDSARFWAVKLGEDFNENKKGDGSLSDAILIKAKDDFRKLLEEAKKQGATDVAGVVTAVFRKAKNGKELLAELNKMAEEYFGTSSKPKLQEITAKKEGEIGFKTAAALHQQKPEKEIVAFDCGNGSFQITQKKDDESYEVLEGPFGVSGAAKIFVEEVREPLKAYTKENPINPMNFEKDIKPLVKKLQTKFESPSWVESRAKDKDSRVIGFGDNEAIFAVCAKALNKKSFTRQEVKEALKQLSDQSNDSPIIKRVSNDPQTAVIKVAILYAVMKKCSISSIHFEQTLGSCPGILNSPEFWAEKTKKS